MRTCAIIHPLHLELETARYYACLFAPQRCVADRGDKSMNQQKNCARVGTQHLRTMPVSILNSYIRSI